MIIEHNDLPVGTAIFKSLVTEEEKKEGLFNGSEYKWVCISPEPIKEIVFANVNYQALIEQAYHYYKKNLK